jgi:hypothetical protein
MDADDIAYPERLERQLAFLEKRIARWTCSVRA